jgi:hypothetical protein
MVEFIRSNLFLRLCALTALILCLSFFVRTGSEAQDPSAERKVPSFTQSVAPVILTETPADAPITISAAHQVSSDPSDDEIAFMVTNVSSKPIAAFAVRQDVEVGGVSQRTVALLHLELSNRVLNPNESLPQYSTYSARSGERHRITLAGQYVLFADGTTWGIDSNDFTQRLAGERAAGFLLSHQLLKIVQAGNTGNIDRALDNDIANLEPPASRSPEWKEGFRRARSSLIQRLKQAESKGGSARVDNEVRQLANTFKGGQ